MAILTEDKIKTASLRFLKTHYKFRPRVGPTTAQFDMESESGIIADGHLFFVTEEGEQFLATFEATSEQIFEEVKYKPELRILFWDSLAAGFIIAALTFAYGFIWNHFTIKEVGWVMTLSILFFAGMIGFWAYRYLLKGHRRYRYIYAIEQFKRYHADDQWVSIADTIFPDAENPYLEELKRQCVDNGIGLLTVSKEEAVHMQIAPARQDVFNNKRKLIHFVTQEIKKGKTWQRRISDKGRDLLDQIFGRSKNSNSLQRYRRSFYKQIFTCVLSTILMTIIFYRELQDRPISYVNKSSFTREVQHRVANGDMETMEYLIDSSSLVSEGAFSESYLSLAANNRRPIALPPSPSEMAVWKFNPEAGEEGSVYLNSEGDNYSTYNCARLFNFENHLYLIQYTLLPDFDLAKREVGRLARKNIDGNILWMGCFSDQDHHYAIFFDLLFPSKEEGQRVLENYRAKLDRAGLDSSTLDLVKIEK